jgi:hypothetical protein
LDKDVERLNVTADAQQNERNPLTTKEETPAANADAVKDNATKAATGNASENAKEKEVPTLKEVLRNQATEEDVVPPRAVTFGKVLGGDILNTKAVRNQLFLILLIAFFSMLYIANRYSCQKNLIEIDKLNKELDDAKHSALSSSSQLTEKSRESRVLEMLKNSGDSMIQIANRPPYIIQINEE